MREMLFRGKRVDNGEWVEGSLLTDVQGNHYIGVFVEKQEQYVMYGRGGMKTAARYEGIGLIQVVPETVGQFTGLTHKNGTKIFEGDILNSSWNTKIIVYFDMDYLQFRAREASASARENSIDYYYSNKTEILGNVHDNPELLN